MQTFPGLCSPERVRALQKISDAVWLVEIHAGSRLPTVALRDEIARRVAERRSTSTMLTSMLTIGLAVLTALDAKPEQGRPTLLNRWWRAPHAARG